MVNVMIVLSIKFGYIFGNYLPMKYHKPLISRQFQVSPTI